MPYMYISVEVIKSFKALYVWFFPWNSFIPSEKIILYLLLIKTIWLKNFFFLIYGHLTNQKANALVLLIEFE